MTAKNKLLILLLLSVAAALCFASAVATEETAPSAAFTLVNEDWAVTEHGEVALAIVSLGEDVPVAFTETILSYLPQDAACIDILSLKPDDAAGLSGMPDLLLTEDAAQPLVGEVYAVGAIVINGVIDWQQCTVEKTEDGFCVVWPESTDALLPQAEEIVLLLFV